MKLKATVLGGIFEIWKLSQSILSDKFRWRPFLAHEPEREGADLWGNEICAQTVLEHVYGISLLATWIVEKLGREVELNQELLLRAFLIHDWSEGELERGDIPDPEKTPQHLLEEYLAFEARFSQMARIDHLLFREAYLLSMAHLPMNVLNCLPKDAQDDLRLIRQLCMREAVLFRLIELTEYLLFALWQFQDYKACKMFVKVADNNLVQLEQLMAELPEFKELIWTREVSTEYCAELEKARSLI